jgi:hypothetical protein
MRFIKRILIIPLIFTFQFVFAQQGKEVLSPYYQNPHPLQVEKAVSSYPVRSKNGSIFPHIGRFNRGTLADSLWLTNGVLITNECAVFNALDKDEFVYISNPGNSDTCDILTSQNITLTPSSDAYYFQFVYSTGNNWTNSDSLLLQWRFADGTYRTLWTSSPSNQTFREITLNVPIDSFDLAQVQFRFVLISTQQVSNIETFLVHRTVFGKYASTPFNENFLSSSTSALPSVQNWPVASGNIFANGPYSTKAVLFNALNDTGGVYDNASAQSGFSDTLQSHLIDLTAFLPTDSVFLRFFHSSTSNSRNSDSIILEGKTISGNWQRMWQAGRSVNDSFVYNVIQLNNTVFKHALFQFRFISKVTYSSSDSIQMLLGGIQVSQKIYLPFIEDFSSSDVIPDQRKWKSTSTYINKEFAKNPPSIGVATFDGLDANATPYGVGRGLCDSLLSQSFNLSGLRFADSVILSFFIQPKGWGETPNNNDSLILEIRSNPCNPFAYKILWSTSAVNYSKDRFTRIDIVLFDSSMFHDDVQILFRNIGSRTGNINHWHIDYIQFDKGRTRNDAYRDVAITTKPTSLIKPYSSMPYIHFAVNPSNYTKTNQRMYMRNNFNLNTPIVYSRLIKNENNVSLDSFANIIPNFLALSDTSIIFNNPINLPNLSTADTIQFNTTYRTGIIGSTDNIPTNDQVVIPTYFSNFFAYDDGSAESGYGIDLDYGGVALGYELAKPDTLFGISMHFNRSFEDVSLRTFDLMVWQAIATNSNGTGETVLKRFSLQAPQYFYDYNAFYYFKFDEPILVPSGKFYIGWEQSQIFNLNVGWDENFEIDGSPAVNPNLAYKIRDLWRNSSVRGTPMMRPIVGKWLTPPVGSEEIEAKTQIQKGTLQVVIYPNPASTILRIDAPGKNGKLDIRILDLQGRIVLHQSNLENEVHLPLLTNGMYLIQVTDESGNSSTEKLIIQQ